MTTTWHQDVRNRNREELIIAGQKVLLENNFTKVGHKEVCERANLSKVTFYKCFNSMDELIFAIQIKIVGEVTDYISQHSKFEKNGLESVGSYLNTYIELLNLRPDYLKYIGFFDHTYSDRYPSEKLQTTYREVVKERGFGGNLLRNFIKQGIEDGSIRSEIKIGQTVIFIMEMIMSLMQRLASRGKLLEEEHGKSPMEIAKISREFVLHYLRNDIKS